MSFSRIFHTYLQDEDLSDPDYEGWLAKQSKYLSVWRQRFFVLKGDKLYFLENMYRPPHGVIELNDCLTVKSVEDKGDKKFCFELKTKTEHYLLCAESKKSKDEWIGRIGKAIVIHSSSYRSSPLAKR